MWILFFCELFFCEYAHECIYLEVLRDRVNKVGKLSHGKERACVCVFIHMKMQVIVYTGTGIGCLKLQVFFRKKKNTHYRALLLKVIYEYKASYGSSPPCTEIHEFIQIYIYTYMNEWQRYCLYLLNYSSSARTPMYSCIFIYI